RRAGVLRAPGRPRGGARLAEPDGGAGRPLRRAVRRLRGADAAAALGRRAGRWARLCPLAFSAAGTARGSAAGTIGGGPALPRPSGRPRPASRPVAANRAAPPAAPPGGGFALAGAEGVLENAPGRHAYSAKAALSLHYVRLPTPSKISCCQDSIAPTWDL